MIENKRYESEVQSDPNVIVAAAVFFLTLAAAPLMQATHPAPASEARTYAAEFVQRVEYVDSATGGIDSVRQAVLETAADDGDSLCCPL